MNSHSDKPSKWIKTCYKPGRKGEGKGLGGEMEFAIQHITDLELVKRASPEQLMLQSRAPSSPQPSPSMHSGGNFHGLRGTYSTGIPPDQQLGWEAVVPPEQGPPLHHPQGKGLKMVSLSCSSQDSICYPQCTFREFCHPE